jgi:putative acetyltransferase
MKAGVTIRSEEPGDAAEVFAIHEAAFGGDAEARLVAALRQEGDLALALTAFAESPVGQVVGHVAFPRLLLEGSDVKAVALAPLAIHPDWQNAGIGTALVRTGLGMLRERGEDLVLVRGHLTYYPRFGFSTDAAQRFRTPYDGLGMHALALTERGERASGEIRYPPAFARILGGPS